MKKAAIGAEGATMKRQSIRKVLGWALGAFVLAQLIPYGWRHENPPVTKEPAWDTPQTRQLAQRACFACHSRETQWPWYSHVAPVSWLLRHDVEEGRSKLDFSAWDQPQRKADDAADELEEDEMPPAIYTVMHPEARLSAEEKAALLKGLKATIGPKGAHPAR